MKKKRPTLPVMIMLLGIAGCGLKGPLYIPPAVDKPAIKTTQSDAGNKIGLINHND